MLHFHSIIIIFFILSTVVGENIVIQHDDTTESLKVTTPDGQKSYKHKSDRISSIHNLVKQAKYGEHWAYKALGDYYYHGAEGFERSVFKAIAFYNLSGMDIDKISENSFKDETVDYLKLTCKLISRIKQRDKKGVFCILDSLNEKGFYEADIIRVFYEETDSDTLAKITMNNILNPRIHVDMMMFTLLGCFLRNWFPELLREQNSIVTAATNKFPYLYDKIAVAFIRKGHEDMDSSTLNKKMAKAISFLESADNEAMLSMEGASMLYRYYQSELKAGRMVADTTDMKRLASVAGFMEP